MPAHQPDIVVAGEGDSAVTWLVSFTDGGDVEYRSCAVSAESYGLVVSPTDYSSHIHPWHTIVEVQVFDHTRSREAATMETHASERNGT